MKKMNWVEQESKVKNKHHPKKYLSVKLCNIGYYASMHVHTATLTSLEQGDSDRVRDSPSSSEQIRVEGRGRGERGPFLRAWGVPGRCPQ